MDSTFSISFVQGNDVIGKTVTLPADTKDYSEIAVAAGATVNYTIGADPDDVVGYAIVSDQPVTLTTTNNPAGTPDVINLVANQPIFWHDLMGVTDSRFANRNPWTSWALHNTGTADCTVDVLIMRDGTP